MGVVASEKRLLYEWCCGVLGKVLKGALKDEKGNDVTAGLDVLGVKGLQEGTGGDVNVESSS